MRHFVVLFLILSFVVPSLSTLSVFAQSREQLEKELLDLENQIKQLQGTITQTQTQKNSLSRDITLLNQKITQSKLKIQSHNKAISKLNENIAKKNLTISELDTKVERQKESMSQIMRKTKYLDEQSLIAFGLQSKSISTFFEDMDSFQSINRSLTQSFEDIRQTKSELEKAKEELLEEKDEETAKKLAQELEKKKVESNQKEKNSLLAITKNQEAEYKKVLSEREKEAGRIRAKLFELRDASSISFGQAYDYALVASKTTGIRPALILAILMQESSLGVNVGACYLKDYNTGEGLSIKNGTSKPRTMSPTRDVPVFTSLMSQLGRDPLKTPVSCWIPMYSGGNPIGWGGAMGPSQFIPSTWKLFEKRIENITGSSKADPWNPRDAIIATALYLADLGAKAGNESSERNAACRYYSGRACSSSSAAAGYGNSVMRKVSGVQADIDKLQR
jgi:peptidoglycan hydrolase CwlO-like protein